MERDDVIEYSLDAHHSEEKGKKIRRKIWTVTAILTLITAVEVGVGIMFHQWDNGWQAVKWGFIVMTLVKAGYIVLTFMHLGDERKVLKYFILIPYIIFIIYLIFIALTEALAVNGIWDVYGG
jgi:cytochrome c oxidase subunit IV